MIKMSTEEFLILYKSALINKISLEQLANLMSGMKVKSLQKRRSELKRKNGVELKHLRSDTSELDSLKLTGLWDTYHKLSSDIIKGKHNTTINKNIYVITSAQNATPVNHKFLKSIKHYCDIRNAELLIIPFRYANPTSIWSLAAKDNDWWDNTISKHLLFNELILNNKLKILGNIKIRPTATNPLSGFDSYTGSYSGIFGHPKIQWSTVATPANILPKILSTTGCITIQNYTDSNVGWKGAFHHSFAAIIVEIESDEIFHLRHIHAGIDGSFYDLDKLYSSTTVTNNIRVEALIAGDSHSEFMDNDVLNATYLNNDSMSNVLKPKYLVFHDIQDFNSRNHHNIDNELFRYALHHNGNDNIEGELQKVANFLDNISTEFSINVLIKSNHDEAFDRWLEESYPKTDPENARFYYYMKYNLLKNIKLTETSYKTIDPFEFWCKHPDSQQGLKNIETTIFLQRDDSFIVKDIELAYHGDAGINGSRGSAKSLSKIGAKTIIGHAHSPNIYEGCYQVGLSCALNLGYVSGPSSWMHTHCIIYPDGKRTLINIMGNNWRL